MEEIDANIDREEEKESGVGEGSSHLSIR